MAVLRTGAVAVYRAGSLVPRFSSWIFQAFLTATALVLSVYAGAQSNSENSAGGLGAQIYHEKCAGCHGNKGQGVPNLFPPLADDPVVNSADPRDHIRTVLFGRQGAAIGGVTYAVTMPSWVSQLTDEEIAAVINYERTNWGNNAPIITPAAVKKIRSEGPP